MMACKRWLKTYFISFFLFGILLENPISTSKRSIGKIPKKIPIIVHSLLVILTTVVILRDLIINSSKITMYNMALATPIISNVIYLYEMWSSESKVEEILLNLNQAKSHLLKFLHAPVKLDRLKVPTGIKCLFGVVIVGTINFAKIFYSSSVVSISYDSLAFILVIIRRLAILLLIILIDFESLLVNSVNQHLEFVRFDRLQLDAGVFEAIHLIHHIRLVYLQLHGVTVMIISRFGWFLMFVLLDHFNSLTTSVFNLITHFVDTRPDGIGRNWFLYLFLSILSTQTNSQRWRRTTIKNMKFSSFQ